MGILLYLRQYAYFVIKLQLEVFEMNKTVIVINGRGGCGKDTLVNAVKKVYKIMNVSSIDKIKEIATYCGWRGTKDVASRTFLANLKQLCIEYNDLPLNYILEKFKTFLDSDNDIMFVHIREGSEIDKLKAHIPTLKTILVHRDETDNALYTNDADLNVEDYTYDYVFSNNGEIEHCQSLFVKLIKEIVVS